MENDTQRAKSSRPTGIYLAFAVIGSLPAVALVAAGFGTRFGLWQFRTGFAILKYAAVAGAVTALLGLIFGIIAIRQEWLRGVLISLVAIACGVLAFGLPFSWKMNAMRYPKIHDITTDIATPPEFDAVIPYRGGPVPYPGASVAVQQREAYPDIRTLVLPVPAEQAFKHAVGEVQDLGWQIVAMDPVHGRIEATDTTFWFGFKDDVVIRITPAGKRSLLDIRSVSRVGISDVGTNAQRVRNFIRAMSRQFPVQLPMS
ncbi:DUF1499 domain-containing protein [Geomesophilobacter sediminis]|uniref:DUF1499 domain-containing protein n=1 Tax=Geomesophilobacter sediminis TaxID=2798584 RepID=A0A8J7JMZ1_9BACT|nr:DUF1499 domain-containing protein [Geomesophilobacter sediminis]MBJ6726290.1 DUF1499 domain-containing protein [Geomesophilobacter sediminis]